MVFKETLELLYSNCSNRIAARIEQSGLSYEDIYYPDPKQISWIKNKKRTKNDRYLICDTVFEGSEKNRNQGIGLIPILNYTSRQEILWGSLEEQNAELFNIFSAIINDLLLDNSNLIDIKYILCDYIPFAKYLSYWDILYNSGNTHLAILYGVTENDVFDNYELSSNNAIKFLYSKCKNDFGDILSEYFDKTSSFKKINKLFEKDFVLKEFCPMIHRYEPLENSLGLRVRNMINEDLSIVPDIISGLNPNKRTSIEVKKAIIRASSSYIVKLEEIQLQYIAEENIFCEEID